MSDAFTVVGKYQSRFNKILGVKYALLDIVCSRGLLSHLRKHGHSNAIKHYNDIPDIISNPDYIGINPNETGISIELIKIYSDNILLGIKLDSSNNRYYVATLFEIQESKLNRRIHSGRLKKIN